MYIFQKNYIFEHNFLDSLISMISENILFCKIKLRFNKTVKIAKNNLLKASD